MEARDESEEEEAHAPSKRPQQESDETATEDAEAVRDGSEEEAESDAMLQPRTPQARITPARTKGHDFSSCFAGF